eukprot:6875855-Pyramimonas_sp.AAC.1
MAAMSLPAGSEGYGAADVQRMIQKTHIRSCCFGSRMARLGTLGMQTRTTPSGVAPCITVSACIPPASVFQ